VLLGVRRRGQERGVGRRRRRGPAYAVVLCA
jgi:hypothetical protein